MPVRTLPIHDDARAGGTRGLHRWPTWAPTLARWRRQFWTRPGAIVRSAWGEAGHAANLALPRGPPTVMTIKSDRWIRRMAEEKGMIEPFEAGQVRTREDGHRMISYGTSSYGYDVRCADEFKIFTNINSTIVDPKDFDARNFVDFRGDVCIIPPNSFALARTVEYFRIPRDTLVVCLGKSTY